MKTTLTPRKIKSVAYAYPSSPDAERFGFKNGCYVVDVRDEGEPPEGVAGFATKFEAIKHASSVEGEWCPVFLMHNKSAISEI